MLLHVLTEEVYLEAVSEGVCAHGLPQPISMVLYVVTCSERQE